MNQMLSGKRMVVMGVANHRSIAWAIAKALHKAGADLAFTYLSEREEKKLKELTKDANIDNALYIPCDVTKDDQVEAAFRKIKETWGTVHGLAHCIAHAKTDDLKGDYIDTSRDGYALAQDISSYSLVAVTRAVRPLMTEGGSVITMTYMGAERVIPNYNVMGIAKSALETSVRYLAYDVGEENIRVNAISAGPVRTLAAKGVKDFNQMTHIVAERAPLKRAVDVEEIANAALFLLSDLATGITGEVLHVDGGYNIMGM
ncbi:enoyl-ACP reductase FabI [Novibacillus thermophilus]|jgi:enoyl-[acyl-carrier protein] reductase I|uniref:Enoyl-[acyl-carrier-protein] reductase [NADH] n=1 Tax=Novibacillus thermophilus TaxID=1471761 RepID=A0A1U9KBU6_9BACL|nr:enoyl-ACP reductase FabI [Novibacillus thermophilus]AQS57463.1 enoyl-[acyl-carrier-protein] reductase [Novibacillus thermophilus]